MESRWGARFSAPLKTRAGVRPQPPVQWVLGLFPGGKATAAWRTTPTPPSSEVKERVELLFCLGVFNFCTCGIVICLGWFVASFKLSCV